MRIARSLLLALLLSGCTVTGLADTRIRIENTLTTAMQASVARCDVPDSERVVGEVEAGGYRITSVDPGCWDVIATWPGPRRWTYRLEHVKEGTTYIVRWE